MFSTNQSFEKENTIYQDQWCGVIAIDEKYNFLLVGHKYAIKVFKLKNRALITLNLLFNHQDFVTSLSLMQKKSFFLSGSHDMKIAIISAHLMSNPKYIIKLASHMDSINHIVSHPIDQEMFISSSKDRTIKFWRIQSKISKKHCFQTINYHKQSVIKLSISEDGSTLISLGMDQLILVLMQQESFWIVKQKIYINKEGPNILFITNEMFIFQPYQGFLKDQSSENIWVYKLDKKNEQYSMNYSIQISDNSQGCIGSFPLFYNHEKRLLLFQNGNSLKIIKLYNLEKGEFNIEQVIFFNNSIQENPLRFICGAISKDWKYLVTWDNTSFCLQVRKYIGLESISIPLLMEQINI
ncbi:unnamed protein product (macronuclear) [Paramecium tetraurelia]|uniref:Uncharacterized protein n=1 Tax=Paramecium tetraurelia TaxID=5888 RepID=A0BVL6_PARTE|nr:uncharacterized protein GSPATT00005829001 [Paramecium tetraurelia]CAK62583.1 unnamed protein product [Paramecium tetraurelia]|eukprot:XP_001429981.1 hypothetical protein (macronuclear) [Paramecium tetraurelia strain d4-2]